MGLFLIILSYAAAAAVWIRFAPYLRRRDNEERTNEALLPKVSIIVPVRNEAQSISKLLASLLLLDYPFVEIIVVDDGSTDCTYALAASFPVKVISAPTKPTGWMGKTWACHVGAEVASGAYLLFTDADTIHRPDGLTRAISFIRRTGAHLVSAAAYHSNCLPWEKFLGPFYCLMHAGASPNDPVGPENPYALGQYLLMDSIFYRKIEGHASVRSKLADDASLARKVMEQGGQYRIYNGSPLCEVQMYKSFSEFLNGWHRNVRLGMNELRLRVMVNTCLPLFTFDFIGILSLNVIAWIPAVSSLVCFAIVQQRLGRFSLGGIFVFPLPIFLFLLLASTAFIFQLLNVPVEWRGRKYDLRGNMTY